VRRVGWLGYYGGKRWTLDLRTSATILRLAPALGCWLLLAGRAGHSTMAAANAADIGSIRATAAALVTRPAVAAQSSRLSSAEREGLIEEVWRVQSEPGSRGEVPVLCVQQQPDPSGAAAPLPVVFVLHGTGGSKEQMRPFLQKYARRGYLACSIDSRYHGERGGPADYTAALIAAYHANAAGEADAEHPFMYDSCWDMMRVIDWVEQRDDVDAARIGMTGISLGGMHTWLTAAVDSRVAAAAPLIGVQHYKYALDNTLWHARVESLGAFFDAIRAEMGKPEVDSEVVASVWQQLCPELIDGSMAMDAPQSLRLIAPRPLLIANGESDMRCPKAGVELALAEAQHAWEEAEAEAGVAVAVPTLYFEPGGGHAVSDEMWRRVDDFFDTHLQPAQQQQQSSKAGWQKAEL
jgi:dienelactone hydrolase